MPNKKLSKEDPGELNHTQFRLNMWRSCFTSARLMHFQVDSSSRLDARAEFKGSDSTYPQIPPIVDCDNERRKPFTSRKMNSFMNHCSGPQREVLVHLSVFRNSCALPKFLASLTRLQCKVDSDRVSDDGMFIRTLFPDDFTA